MKRRRCSTRDLPPGRGTVPGRWEVQAVQQASHGRASAAEHRRRVQETCQLEGVLGAVDCPRRFEPHGAVGCDALTQKALKAYWGPKIGELASYLQRGGKYRLNDHFLPGQTFLRTRIGPDRRPATLPPIVAGGRLCESRWWTASFTLGSAITAPSL